jgi:hypothetical protein
MFYSFAVSVFVPQIPDIQQNQIIQYTDARGVVNFSTLATTMESAVSSQSTVPFLELGALIFFSSSILINLVLNFITAIPQMLTWLLDGLFEFLPVAETIQISVKGIFIVMTTIIYYLLFVLYILGVRTQTTYD